MPRAGMPTPTRSWPSSDPVTVSASVVPGPSTPQSVRPSDSEARAAGTRQSRPGRTGQPYQYQFVTSIFKLLVQFVTSMFKLLLVKLLPVTVQAGRVCCWSNYCLSR